MENIGELRKMELLELHPGDVIVVTVNGRLTEKTYLHVEELIEESFPNHKCIVLEDDISIGVIRP